MPVTLTLSDAEHKVVLNLRVQEAAKEVQRTVKLWDDEPTPSTRAALNQALNAMEAARSALDNRGGQ